MPALALPDGRGVEPHRGVQLRQPRLVGAALPVVLVPDHRMPQAVHVAPPPWGRAAGSLAPPTRPHHTPGHPSPCPPHPMPPHLHPYSPSPPRSCLHPWQPQASQPLAESPPAPPGAGCPHSHPGPHRQGQHPPTHPAALTFLPFRLFRDLLPRLPVERGRWSGVKRAPLPAGGVVPRELREGKGPPSAPEPPFPTGPSKPHPPSALQPRSPAPPGTLPPLQPQQVGRQFGIAPAAAAAQVNPGPVRLAQVHPPHVVLLPRLQPPPRPVRLRQPRPPPRLPPAARLCRGASPGAAAGTGATAVPRARAPLHRAHAGPVAPRRGALPMTPAPLPAHTSPPPPPARVVFHAGRRGAPRCARAEGGTSRTKGRAGPRRHTARMRARFRQPLPQRRQRGQCACAEPCPHPTHAAAYGARSSAPPMCPHLTLYPQCPSVAPRPACPRALSPPGPPTQDTPLRRQYVLYSPGAAVGAPGPPPLLVSPLVLCLCRRGGSGGPGTTGRGGAASRRGTG